MVYHIFMIKTYENKAMNKNKVSIKLNAPLKTHKAGEKINIDVDDQGVPLSRYWRDRFNDAKIDNCIEILETKRSKK